MILIDTSVWIDFLAGHDTPQAKSVEASVESREDICICGIVLTEVLQGIHGNKEYDKTRAILSELIFLPMTQETFFWPPQSTEPAVHGVSLSETRPIA